MKIAVTIEEAIAMSGIGRAGSYKLIRAGKIHRRKQERRTLISDPQCVAKVRSSDAGGLQGFDANALIELA